MAKKDIKDYTFKELKHWLAEINEPEYRAKQIFFWLYQRAAGSFGQMSNLPQTLKDQLEQNYYIGALTLSQQLKSADQSEKFLFQLSDGNFIETVLIPAKKRKTACLSTQVGCKFGCSFCASGKRGLVRNLSPAEIVNQAVFLGRNLKHELTNYVFMGMGEPLDNLRNVSQSIMIMNAPQGLAIGARRITISTCGIIPGIEELSRLGLQVNLSISLHAANNKLRNELVPINRRYPLEKLIQACQEFIKKTKRTITLEYVIIKDKNDSLKDAEGLAQIAKGLRAKVNLIPFSAIGNLNLQPAEKKQVILFMQQLRKKRVGVTLRQSRGADIQAACGQLAGRK